MEVAWHPNGKLLATACADLDIYVWDVARGTRVAVLHGHQSETTSLRFSHQGDFLLSSSWDGTARLWDPIGGQPPVRIAENILWLSQDDSRMAAVSAGLFSWGEIATGHECRILHSYAEPSKGPRECRFSKNGRWLISAHSDGVRIWDAQSANEIHFLPLGYTWAAFMHPDGRRFFTSGHGGLQEWAIEHGQVGVHLARTLLDSGKCTAASPSANGESIAVIDAGVIRVFDVQSGLEKASFGTAARYVALSPDGKLAAVGRITDSSADTEIWEVGTKTVLKELESSCDPVAFSPDGHLLATANGVDCRFWNLASWKCDHVFRRDERSGASPITFSSDGQVAAIPLTSYTVRLLDTKSWKELATLSGPEPQYLSSIAFNSDDSMLAIGCETKEIQLWNLRLIRQELAEMKLDWETPSLSTGTPRSETFPIAETEIEIAGPAMH